MAGYGDQGYNQDFYESGYDMDGMQGQQTGWQQHAAAATVPAQAPSQWSGVGQQQGFYQPTSFGVQQGYGQQGNIICDSRMTYTHAACTNLPCIARTS